jgi:cytochrome c oxidase cbb3-type subunit 3
MPRCMPALAVLLLSTAFASSMSAQTPPAPPKRPGFAGAGGDYKTYPQATLDAGKRVYTSNCAFCHGGNAKGGETGPSLLGSLIVLHDEDGKQVGEFIHHGRPDKGMPAFNLPEDQVKDLAAFLHDGVRAAAERSTYKILNIVVGDPKAGETYFNGAGKCNTCHSVTGDLAHVGAQFEPVELQQKIVMPRGTSPATERTVTVTDSDGKVTQGRLRHVDNFSVTLIGKDGNSITYPRDTDEMPKVEIHDPLQAHVDLLNQYTDTDIHNLTAYLVTLK